MRADPRARLACSLLAVGLSACSTVTPVVRTDAPYQPDAGYVAASIGKESVKGFTLEVDPVPPRGFYTVTFGEKGQLSAIAVPPGRYRVTRWMHVPTTSQFVGPGARLGRTFEVKPGHVVYLGRFEGQALGKTMTLQPVAVDADSVPSLVASAYPALGKAPVDCLVCSAAEGDASTAAHRLEEDMGPFVVRTRNGLVSLEYPPEYDAAAVGAPDVISLRKPVVPGDARGGPAAANGRPSFRTVWIAAQEKPVAPDLPGLLEWMRQVSAQNRPNWKETRAGPTTFAGQEAVELVGSWDPPDDVRSTTRDVLFLRGGHGYAVTAGAPVEDFDAASPELTRLLEGMKFER